MEDSKVSWGTNSPWDSGALEDQSFQNDKPLKVEPAQYGLHS